MKYSFTKCDNCGEIPTVEDTGLCDVCCFGEVEGMYDWIWEDYKGNRKAKRYAKYLLWQVRKDGLHYVPEIEKRLKEIARGE